jgi:hypothetical protein
MQRECVGVSGAVLVVLAFLILKNKLLALAQKNEEICKYQQMAVYDVYHDDFSIENQSEMAPMA